MNRLKQQQLVANSDNIEQLIEDGDATDKEITEENFETIFEKNRQYIENKQQQLAKKGIDFQIPTVSKTGEFVFHQIEESTQPERIETPPVVTTNENQKVKKGKQQKNATNSKVEEVPAIEAAAVVEITDKPKKGKKKVEVSPETPAEPVAATVTEATENPKKGKKTTASKQPEPEPEVPKEELMQSRRSER